jgi:phage-related tail fiber protein
LLQVGYGTNLYTVFAGNISQAWSVREGNNFITQVECFDGGFAIVNGKTDRNFIAGTSQEEILTAIVGDLKPTVVLGAISPSFTQDASGKPYTIPRGSTYSSKNTYELLQEITGNALYIDNQKAFILDSQDSFISSIVQIDASTGLLVTPLREDNIATFDMLLEPSLQIGQRINLQSQTFDTTSSGQSNINGLSKVVSLKHRGMISGSVCGSAITTVGFYYGIQGGVIVVPS